VLPADHPLAGKKEIDRNDLVDEDFIGLKEGYGLRYLFDKLCHDLQISPKLAFEGEEVSTVLGLVSSDWELLSYRKQRITAMLFRIQKLQITNVSER
jgi:DNA-binding transcriptional LysR family regulator